MGDPIIVRVTPPAPAVVRVPAPNVTRVRVQPGVDPEQIETAVDSYLQAHPPAGGLTFDQPTPVGSWIITHNLGRLPDVSIYVGGELVEADVASTTTITTISFPTPTAGFAVLT